MTDRITRYLEDTRAAAALLALLLGCLLALPCGSALAQKTHLRVGNLGGTQPVFFREALGLAVDQSTGDLLVTDARKANEQQTVALAASSDPGGTFKLSFKGATTGSISAAEVAAGIQSKLEALATIGAGNVFVNRENSRVFSVEFQGALEAQDVPELTCDATSLTPAGATCVVTTTASSATPHLSRFKPDGEPDPFSALGTNVIDAGLGLGGKSCAEEASSCDHTPQNGFSFGSSTGEEEIAIDESGGVADGDIYVTQAKHSGGNLVDAFASSGEYLGQITAAGTTAFGTLGELAFSPCGVAVDPSGSLYLGGGFDERVYKFAPTANPPQNGDYVGSFTDPGHAICSLAAGAGPSAGSLFANRFNEFEGANTVLKFSGALASQGVAGPGKGRQADLLAVDPVTGHLYSFDGKLALSDLGSPTGGLEDQIISEFDASGQNLIGSFPSQGRPSGIAVDGASGDVYLSSTTSVAVYGPTVTIPGVSTGATSITGDTSAALGGTVEPEGVALEECAFEYVEATEYEPDTEHPYARGQVVPCAESAVEIGTGTKAVHADVSGLTPETLYHYRLLAKNFNASLYPQDPRGISLGLDETFTTPSKPAIERQWAAEVGFTEAKLKATINPGNSPTTFHLEWGRDSSYGHSSVEVAIGTDATGHTVSLLLEQLEPATTYHYRFAAHNGIGSSDGPDRTFTTPTIPLPPPDPDPCSNSQFRSGFSAFMPDCRAYEMVSPVDKADGDIFTLLNSLNEPAGLDQSAGSGEKFTYSAFRAFAGAQSAPATSQYMATRGVGGWTTSPISPSRGTTRLGTGNTLESQFQAFTDDLCTGWVRHDTDPPLAAGAVEHFPNLYTADLCGGEESYEALTRTLPPEETPENYQFAVQGISADGSHTAFRANAQLAVSKGASSAAGKQSQCYEFSGGELRLISVLPSGVANPTACSIGTANRPQGFRSASVANAISADGSHIFWTASATESGPGKIYLRIGAKNSTIPVSEAGEATSGTAGNDSQFWAAAADGSKAIYSTGDLRHGEADLYEFTVSGRVTHPIAGEVSGVLGVSQDASRVYLVSRETLTGANAEGSAPLAGKPNLYFYDASGQSLRFIGQLSSVDDRVEFGEADVSPVAEEPSRHVARVSADGTVATFVSTAPLTGFDSADVETGEADAEVFLYEASADGGAGRLLCVSCNPSGAAPTGGRPTLPIPMSVGAAARLVPGVTQLHAPRELAEDGKRVFFDSYEALLPRDTNNMEDVYEWEAPGAGPSEAVCTESSPGYSPLNGGCIGLISSGKSPQGSEFVDASADGRDVFFTTGSSLLSQDQGLIDIYDAREGGGFPPPREPAAPCQGEACQASVNPPNDPTPASAAFEGPGNVKEAPRERCAGSGRHKRSAAARSRCGKKHRYEKPHGAQSKKRHKRVDKGRR